MSIHAAGTVTLTVGSTAVTGTGSMFSGNVANGDLFCYGGRVGVVADVPSDTSLTLALPWSGDAATDTPDYVIVQTGSAWSLTMSAVDTLLAILARLG